MSRVRPLLALGALACFAAAAAAAAAAAQTLTDPSLSVTNIVPAGLSQPTSMAFVGHDDFLVLEKNTGRVRRVEDGVLAPNPVLTVPVDFNSERGMLGIAVNSETPKRVFLYYTASTVLGNPGFANRVIRYDWNPVAAALQNPVLLFDLPILTGPNHNGGVVVLGPPGQAPGVGDGALLYAVIGDLNRQGQLQNFPAGPPPDDTSVILRVRQDGTPAPGNPFAPYCSVSTAISCVSSAGCPGGETCRTEVARYYAYGVRNSFGLALDPATGALWDTENGPGDSDEVNRIAPGFNSGWFPIMGPDARDMNGSLADLFNMPNVPVGYSDPEFTWLQTIAPTGIALPFGSALGPAYDAMVLVGDSNYGALSAFPLNGARTGFVLGAIPGLADLEADNATERDAVRLGTGFGSITDLEVGPDRALYVVSLFPPAVYRVTGAAAVPLLPGATGALLATGLALAAAGWAALRGRDGYSGSKA